MSCHVFASVVRRSRWAMLYSWEVVNLLISILLDGGRWLRLDRWWRVRWFSPRYRSFYTFYSIGLAWSCRYQYLFLDLNRAVSDYTKPRVWIFCGVLFSRHHPSQLLWIVACSRCSSWFPSWRWVPSLSPLTGFTVHLHLQPWHLWCSEYFLSKTCVASGNQLRSHSRPHLMHSMQHLVA